ncbi:MAG: ABC transporter permease [Planctomycetota bacterium]
MRHARTVLLSKLVRDLWGRRGAVAALALIMTAGIGCYVGMAAVWRDMDGRRRAYYQDQHLADFTVDLKRAPTWVTSVVQEHPNVEAVQGRVAVGVRIELPKRIEPIAGLAISLPVHRGFVLNDVLLRSGTYFSGPDAKEVILNEAFAGAHKLVPGSRVRALLRDRLHELLVVGTAMSPEFVYVLPPDGGLAPDPARYGILYCPERLLQESCDLAGAYNQLVGLVRDDSPRAIENTLEAISERLDAYGVTNTTPRHRQASARYLADELSGLRKSATIMPAIFLVVGALVLNVLVSRLVAQQRSVIGTLRALGYGKGAIRRHYLAMGAVIGAGGGAGGVGFGFCMQHWLLAVYREYYALPRVEAHVYWDIVAAGVSISILCAVLGAWRAVGRAAGLAPAEAMRPPPPEVGHRIALERVRFLWTRLSFQWRMTLRAIFRNPLRSTVTVFASVVATALLVSTFALLDALAYLIHHEFEKTSRQDVTISLRDPVGRAAIAEVRALSGISDAEGELGVICDLSNGPHRRRAPVTGLPEGSRMHTPLDHLDRPIRIPPKGLVLSHKLAELLGVSVGRVIRVRPLVGRRTEVEVPVTAVVETFLGLGAYAEIGYLSRLLGEELVTNTVLGKSFRGGADEAFLAEASRRPEVVSVSERRKSLAQVNETFGKHMGTMIGMLVLFAGLIAFGSVLNASMVSLSERAREVGTLRVLGYAPGEVARIFSGESFALNAVGISLGLLAGVGLARVLSLLYDTELYRFPTVVLPSRLALSAGIVLVFVATADQLIGAMIRRLPWSDVLKVRE